MKTLILAILLSATLSAQVTSVNGTTAAGVQTTGALVAIKSVTDSAFGAKCDNSTDDQSALQAAFTSGGIVHIPGGVTCLHSSVLTVPSNTSIVCDGSIAPAVLKATNTTGGSFASAIQFNGVSNSSIAGCSITGVATTRQTQVLASGVAITGSTNIRVSKTRIFNTWNAGIFVYSLNALGGTAGSTKVELDSNIIDASYANGIIFEGGSSDGIIALNQISNSGDGGIEVSSSTLDLAQTSDVAVNGNLLVGCETGINSAGGARLHIFDNTIINPVQQGISIYTSGGFNAPSDVDLHSNYIFGATNASYYSIALDSTTRASIKNNVISGGRGIFADASAAQTALTITNNTLTNILSGGGIYLAGNVTGAYISLNTVNGVSAGTCVSIFNTTAAVTDLNVSDNHCSNITGSSTTYGTIDIVGATNVSGGNNILGGTNTVNAGPLRFTGGATTAQNLNIGTQGNPFIVGPSSTLPSNGATLLVDDTVSPTTIAMTGISLDSSTSTEGWKRILNHNSSGNVQILDCPTYAVSSTVCLRVYNAGNTINVDGLTLAQTPSITNLGNVAGINLNGPITLAATIQPGLLYSAAGTPLPTCNSGVKGLQATVSDATSPTYNGTYTSGGTVPVPVICNGTAWLTH